MSRTVFQGDGYKVTHTLEEAGPHVTRREDYYDKEFRITFLICGEGSCFVEGNCYTLVPGDVIVMRANELRHFKFEQPGKHERLSLYISPSAVSPLWNANLPLFRVFKDRPLGVGNRLQLSGENKETIWSVAEEIKTQMMSFAHLHDALREAELHLLVLRMLVRLCVSEKTEKEGEACSGDPAIWSVCQYIHQNLQRKLTYQHIQEHCRVSRYQLGEVFRKGTGMTLTEYISQKRLIRVSELVMGGTKIESAAVQAGFPNYSHFYKMFVKYRGVSPKGYFKVLKDI